MVWGKGRLKVDVMLSDADRAAYDALLSSPRTTGTSAWAWLTSRGYRVGLTAVLNHKRQFDRDNEQLRRATRAATAYASAAESLGGPEAFSSAALTRINELAMGHLFGPNVLFVRLHADDNNKPGAVIAQTVVVDQMQPLPSDPKVNHPPVVATFPGATLLEGGTNYWLSLDVDTSVTDAWLAWNYNITNDRALRADRTDGGPWVTYPQFPEPRGTMRINATPVPEPTGVVLFAAVGMALARRRSR